MADLGLPILDPARLIDNGVDYDDADDVVSNKDQPEELQIDSGVDLASEAMLPGTYEPTATASRVRTGPSPSPNLYPKLPQPLSSLASSRSFAGDQGYSSSDGPTKAVVRPPRPRPTKPHKSIPRVYDSDTDDSFAPAAAPDVPRDGLGLALGDPVLVAQSQAEGSHSSASVVSHTSATRNNKGKGRAAPEDISPAESKIGVEDHEKPEAESDREHSVERENATHADIDGADTDDVWDDNGGHLDGYAPDMTRLVMSQSEPESDNEEDGAPSASMLGEDDATSDTPLDSAAESSTDTPQNVPTASLTSAPTLLHWKSAREKKIFVTASSINGDDAPSRPSSPSKPTVSPLSSRDPSPLATHGQQLKSNKLLVHPRQLSPDLSRVVTAASSQSSPVRRSNTSTTFVPTFTNPQIAASPFTASNKKGGKKRTRGSFDFRPTLLDEFKLRGPALPSNDSSRVTSPTTRGKDQSAVSLTIPRRKTFGGSITVAPDVEKPVSSPSPHGDITERALRRMSANHGFSQAIVRGVWEGAGAGLSFTTADAVLARMRFAAEREAERALGDITGDDIEVERITIARDEEDIGSAADSQPDEQDLPAAKATPVSSRLSMLQLQLIPSVDFGDGTLVRKSRRSSLLRREEPPKSSATEEGEHRWTAREDETILSGSPERAYLDLEASYGPAALMARLAQLLAA